MSELAIQAQQRLLEEFVAAEERWRDLVQGLRDIVFRCDASGRLTFVNNAWEAVLGNKVADCQGRTLIEFAHDEDRAALESMIGAETISGAASRHELRFRRSDDTWLWLEVSVQARRSGTVVGLMYNIHPFKVLESELRVARAEMELRVVERTAALQHEISIRAEIEEELRSRLQTIEAQRETIQRLATPVIEVSEGVLIVPLVGVVDHERAEQLLQNVLHAVSASTAGYVLVDVTGVPSFGRDVAEYVLRLDKATRLLGTTCILVGISPAVASLLVTLGVQLSGLETAGTLRDGLRRTRSRAQVRRRPPAEAPKSASVLGEQELPQPSQPDLDPELEHRV